jgi:hypothetical protein
MGTTSIKNLGSLGGGNSTLIEKEKKQLEKIK